MNGYPHHIAVMGVTILSQWLPRSHCCDEGNDYGYPRHIAVCDEGNHSLPLFSYE